MVISAESLPLLLLTRLAIIAALPKRYSLTLASPSAQVA
jgi:hypothetical protein